jgi:pilus assembly protein CpaC
MHRTNTVPRMTYWGVLLSVLLAGVVAAGAGAQERAQPPAGGPAGGPAGPRVPVITIPVNGTYRLESPFRVDGKPTVIRTVVNENENVLRVQALADTPTAVLLVGLARGTSRVTLTDINNNRAAFDVIVEIDIALLRTTIRKAVPTSNVEPVLAGSRVVILTGWVERAEDVDTIMRTVQTLIGAVVAVPVAPPPGTPVPAGGAAAAPPPPTVVAEGAPQVINAMRVGGVQQVQLDVIVARVSRDELRRMSFDFMNFGVHHVFASTPGGGFIVPSSGIAGNLPGVPTFTNLTQTVNGAAPNLFLALFNPEQDFFALLQLLRTEAVAKILTEPKLITMSGRPATLLSGGQQAVPQPGGLGTVAVQFFPFGTQLTFLPVVLGNGKIHLEVEPEVSILDQASGTTIAGTAVPGRLIQRVHTSVEMEDGQTFAIGGLIEHTIGATATKVPVLGDVPFLGAAFSSKFYEERESELLVLVTPHLVDPMSCDQLPKLLPGQETRTPDDFELFLEGILEAPRGPRTVCHNGRYVPAYKNGPTVTQYPCAANQPDERGGHFGRGGCCAGGTFGGAAMTGVAASDEPLPRIVSGPPAGEAGLPPAAGGEARPTALPPTLASPTAEGQK